MKYTNSVTLYVIYNPVNLLINITS